MLTRSDSTLILNAVPCLVDAPSFHLCQKSKAVGFEYRFCIRILFEQADPLLDNFFDDFSLSMQSGRKIYKLKLKQENVNNSSSSPRKSLKGCLVIPSNSVSHVGMGTIPIPSIDTVDTCELAVSIDTSSKCR